MENGVGGSTPAPGGGSKRCISAYQTFFLSARFAIYFYFVCVCVLKNVTHTPFHAPRSRQMPSSPPPRAARVCRRAPGQSGKSWTCGDWRAAASQSEPSTRRPHWRHNRERQQLRVIEHILQSHKRDKKSFQKPFSFSLQQLSGNKLM